MDKRVPLPAYRGGIFLKRSEINALIRCIQTGEKLPSHIDTVIITAKMMQGIYDSAAQHKEIVF